ncbi:hypothetical protein [Polynucleobacter sp.]|uniref:hypothetical protein n=1 Tax=Polynucleobacter sp. TaxID=2029855 RepID=UPI003F6983D2
MNNLKAVSKTDNELVVENYIILFGGEDISGEFFTKDTEIKSAYTDLGILYVDFEHGYDVVDTGNDPDNVLGYVDWKSAKIDDKGIFVKRVLNRQSQYVQYISDLIDAGVVGTSSQAVSGKTVKKSSGEIIEWPLMRDSITFTPMEPRMLGENALSAAKSLVKLVPSCKSLRSLVGLKVVEAAKNIELITDLKSAEKFLRDSGFSRTEAVSFMARVKSLKQSDSAEDMQQLIDALKTRDKILT